MSLKEANAAKELLLDRLMAVHPEVNGGGLVMDLQGEHDYIIKINLEKSLPRREQAKLPSEFMGYHVMYEVTGWVVAQ